eukprot:CAMPEP_0117437136 /NCGR_PEP_ID=MMETSP0759-20121206/1367_1 /TAXON_ID=63605 /ORGANISM="Percolomonas cosmopolitus, Strain WS" /LENGTH=405 /DNA_ID=CAMNT_0005228757 /DNA_START=23 /DNA_END=1240 /DNA_ORIENTATION=-
MSSSSTLTQCQPLQLSLSPSLLSNNLTTPIIYAHDSTLILLPHQIYGGSSGATNTNDSSSSGGIVSSVAPNGKQNEHSLVMNRKIMAFDCIHALSSSSSDSKIISADYVAIALENGLSVWERQSQRMIFTFEFENDSQCANSVLCVAAEGRSKKQQSMPLWNIVLGTTEGCLMFELTGNRVEKKDGVLGCFSADSESLKQSYVAQLALAPSSPGHAWISDAFGRVQLFDLQKQKEAGVKIGAFAYYGGAPQGFELHRLKSGFMGFDKNTDVLSARPVEVLNHALVCAYISGVIRLFDVKSGRLLASINAHVAPIRGLALQPTDSAGNKMSTTPSDKCIIASASEDQYTLVWHITLAQDTQKISSVECVHQQHLTDHLLTGVTWLNERTIGTIAYEKKFLSLFKIP